MSDDTIKKNISKNIGKYREQAGLSQKELAKRLGVVPSRISNWETGANCPTIDILFEVCEILNVSINDIYGIYPDSKFILKYGEQELLKKYRDLDPIGQEHVNTILQWETERMKSKKEEKPTRIISYYQKLASAGTGEYLFSDIPTDFIEVEDNEKSRNADFVIGVNGDSMKPVYNDGDKVFVKKTIELSVGEIGIFIDGNNCYIKELGENELISINKEYKNIKNLENVKVIGKVLDKVE
ncbi:XRE family transcriptional regulator [Acetivibrio ethanolgignens]|uniref:HTH cro/C1-type domain-containing protein n=1 Tax=Acetivibrio ethanolgignens TaxID=290052 RepID=A0A0V8QJ63_9FIRM|nr:XRE family transcriptional regulator [Acetivibrio ethanolgignens]KSV60278.1 hypothetical protein ASU35_05860 [Acetivibrio ethanolgignens]